jgi:hypothetical protein
MPVRRQEKTNLPALAALPRQGDGCGFRYPIAPAEAAFLGAKNASFSGPDILEKRFRINALIAVRLRCTAPFFRVTQITTSDSHFPSPKDAADG